MYFANYFFFKYEISIQARMNSSTMDGKTIGLRFALDGNGDVSFSKGRLLKLSVDFSYVADLLL